VGRLDPPSPRTGVTAGIEVAGVALGPGSSARLFGVMENDRKGDPEAVFRVY